MRSSIAVPIEVDGQCIGSLHVDHREPRFFGPADLALAEALAAQAGAAVERARLNTARREAEEAREEAQRRLANQTEELARRETEAAALRELDRLKDQFIAMISHELRTPLSLVFGYAELLQTQINSLDTPTMETMVAKIRIGAEQLTRLVDDLLDFARIERGEIVVRTEDFDLAPTLRELAHAMRSQPNGEQIVLEVPTRLPVHGDRTRVAQAVSHLLGNALKYAPAGPVTLRARAGDGVVRVEVQDQGPGIPADEQPRVWDKFYRGVAVSELNVARGTGIGLAVVKTMVEAQRGRVGLQSVPGEGACFWFELPAPGQQARLSA
jgi:signal transduction histidine kinase